MDFVPPERDEVERTFLASLNREATPDALLVYADWLDDRGAADRAEAVRNLAAGRIKPYRKRDLHLSWYVSLATARYLSAGTYDVRHVTAPRWGPNSIADLRVILATYPLIQSARVLGTRPAFGTPDRSVWVPWPNKGWDSPLSMQSRHVPAAIARYLGVAGKTRLLNTRDGHIRISYKSEYEAHADLSSAILRYARSAEPDEYLATPTHAVFTFDSIDPPREGESVPNTRKGRGASWRERQSSLKTRRTGRSG